MGPFATRTRCFQEGADARAAGLGQISNPYGLQTPEREEWDAGWSATYDLDEDSDPASNRDQPADEPDDAEGSASSGR